jgi:hypothetical protein
MIQDFDSQLQVSLRALEEVVAPALGAAEKHVVEQLMLAIATISFVKTRLPEARRFYRMELRSLVSLGADAVRIAGACDTLGKAIEAGQSTLADPEADIGEHELASRTLRDAVTSLSHRSVGAPHQSKLETAILEQSGALVAQYRQWCLPFGFELHPESLAKAAW